MDDIKRKEHQALILKEFIENVSFDGWSEYNLKNSCARASFEEAYGYLMFPDGVKDLIKFLGEQTDEEMLQVATEEIKTINKVREKIAFIVMLRLSIMEKYKKALKKVSLSSFNIKGLWDISDKMWIIAGDKSNDFNYYSKRFLLSIVYMRTFLYWLNNDEKEVVRIFLDERISEIMKIGQLKEIKTKTLEIARKIPFVRLLFRKSS